MKKQEKVSGLMHDTPDSGFVSNLTAMLAVFEEWCVYEGEEKTFANFIQFVTTIML